MLLIKKYFPRPLISDCLSQLPKYGECVSREEVNKVRENLDFALNLFGDWDIYMSLFQHFTKNLTQSFILHAVWNKFEEKFITARADEFSINILSNFSNKYYELSIDRVFITANNVTVMDGFFARGHGFIFSRTELERLLRWGKKEMVICIYKHFRNKNGNFNIDLGSNELGFLRDIKPY